MQGASPCPSAIQRSRNATQQLRRSGYWNSGRSKIISGHNSRAGRLSRAKVSTCAVCAIVISLVCGPSPYRGTARSIRSKGRRPKRAASQGFVRPDQPLASGGAQGPCGLHAIYFNLELSSGKGFHAAFIPKHCSTSDPFGEMISSARQSERLKQRTTQGNRSWGDLGYEGLRNTLWSRRNRCGDIACRAGLHAGRRGGGQG
ncbi:hypothetical protein CHELA1G2_13287 [Hyphomicrobiales bacterium]|nr:hypothetical protein CHELA1G2_13287 [Hyphomicrobiales bacterium]